MGGTVSDMEIKVRVCLFADLRRYLPRGSDGPLELSLASGSTVQDLLGAIGIRQGSEVTAGIDGELATKQTVLRHGDEVLLISPMEGGAIPQPKRLYE
jgi:sulfur carrier protein ThiS